MSIGESKNPNLDKLNLLERKIIFTNLRISVNIINRINDFALRFNFSIIYFNEYTLNIFLLRKVLYNYLELLNYDIY